MKYIKNEKGMALLTVILMFTVFTILGMVVFNAITNNTKQINKTEETIQATDIAEMGVTFYKTAIQEKIEALNEVGTASITSYFDSLNISLGSLQIKKSISEDDVYFELQPVEISDYDIAEPNALVNNIISYKDTSTADKKIGVILKSKGYAKGEIRYISLQLIYNINLNSNGNYTVSKPGSSASTTVCSDPSQINGVQCVYTTPQSFVGNLNNIKDSTLYYENDFNINGTIVNVQGGELHVKGDFTANEINNFQEDGSNPSQLEVEGNASIGIINNTRNGFVLFVGGDLNVNSIGNSVRDHSTFIVLGTADIKSGLQNINGTCKLCAYKVENYTNVTTDRIFIPEDPTFNEECRLYGGPASYNLLPTPVEIIDYH